MIKKHAKNMNFDDFKNEITQDMLCELTKMNISYNRAYSIFLDILKESEADDLDDIGNMESIIRNIIIEHTDEILANEFDKYDSDWE